MSFKSRHHKEKIIIRHTDNKKQPLTVKISTHLQANIDHLQLLFDQPDDLKIRKITFSNTAIEGIIVFFEGLVQPLSVQQGILTNLELNKTFPDTSDDLFQFIYTHCIAINDVQKTQTFDDVSAKLLAGYTAIFIDGVSEALIINTIGGEYRAIEEPVTETLIRGSRTGFVENIETNVALIRRRARDPNLRFQTHIAGKRSQTNIVVAYIDDIIDPKILKEVNRRLKSIDIDIIPESGYIEEWIEDSFLSPFPQILNTERP
ncbi:MAG TPA: spore germination protein, partial [Pseudogracilibacillus sp.]|nr:spore germination protein [Pseudogracilibacillus sp.]